MFPSKTKASARSVAALLALGFGLAGCSDIYYDRRDTIALGADDAIATNRVTHMVDPWPRHVGNRNLAFNGERIQCAVERYRHNRVIEPRHVTTSSAASQSAQQGAGSGASCPTLPAVTPPAAPVK